MTEANERQESTTPPSEPGGGGADGIKTSETAPEPEFAMGGQAVLEGVMMRGPKSYAVAVRRPQGDIVMMSRPFLPITKRKKCLGLPVVRGAVSLVEMLFLGYRTLDFSAKVAEQGFLEQEAEEKAAKEKESRESGSAADSHEEPPASSKHSASVAEALGATPVIGLASEVSELPSSGSCCRSESCCASSEEEAEGKNEPGSDESSKSDESLPESTLGGWQMAGIFALSMGLAMLLFVALPNYATILLGKLLPSGELVEIDDPIAYNLVSGAVRVLVIVGYIWAISLMSDIRRLFQYHGAEHKVVMAFEKKIPLEIESLRPVTTLHPRCGTTFIAIVLLISIFFFALLAALIIVVYPGFGDWSIWARKPVLILSHIFFMPLVGGVAYEVTRRAGKHPDFWLYRALLAPGFAFQKLTTKEPDDSMLEVALTSFHEALEPRELAE